MKKMDHTADFSLWTPWGPQFTPRPNAKVAALRSALRRLKPSKVQIDKKDREDLRLGKPECAYEP